MLRFDTNTLLMMILLLAVINIFMGGFDLQATLLSLPGLVLALTFHEYAHAKMADRLGDPTPEEQGRLTLSPVAHMDPVGTICLLFANFGWGRPVQVNPSYFRNPARDNMLVAAAGPIMNFILAFVLLIIYAILSISTPALIQLATGVTSAWTILYEIVAGAAVLNVSLGVFNLLPVPPLDGSKIFAYFLKGKAREFLYTLEQYSTIIIAILFITKLPAMIISPIVRWITTGMIYIIGLIIGLFL